jgi:hypothetical protein
MSNFQEFIENVKAGKIEGLTADLMDGYHERWLYIPGSAMQFSGGKPTLQRDADHLCAHIRRWLTGKGLLFTLGASDLYVLAAGNVRGAARIFKEGSELDWHIDAANFVCKQGVEG